MITDMSTIGNDPFDVVDSVKGNLDDNGNIKKGSNLANYVSYCSQRSSAFGVADSNKDVDHTGHDNRRNKVRHVDNRLCERLELLAVCLIQQDRDQNGNREPRDQAVDIQQKSVGKQALPVI